MWDHVRNAALWWPPPLRKWPSRGRVHRVDLGREAQADCVPRAGRIGLLAHCGTGNLGDEATVATVLQHIRSRWSAASLVGVSMDPEDTARRHGIPCFPMRQSVFPFQREWSSEGSSTSRTADPARYSGKLKAALKTIGPVFRAAKALKHAFITPLARFMREIVFLGRSVPLAYELDLLVVCGGGQLLDWGGPWAFPYTLFKWMLLAKCAGAKCIFLNSGAGPLDAPLSRWFVRRALSMADYISLRDRVSSELLRKIGFRGKMSVVADSVWGLRLPDGLAQRRSGPADKLVIGLAPMAYGDTSRHWVDDHSAYRRLIGGLAEFSGRMLARGHCVRIFSSDIWFDSQALADLEAAIRRSCPAMSADRLTRESVTGIEDLLAALSRVDCYVTCRFHGVILASLLNVPSLALAPHPKVATVMNDLGLSDYCVDIDKCDANGLTASFDHLVDRMDEVKARIRLHAERYQHLLAAQFDCLFRKNGEFHTEEEHEPLIWSVR
jgi:polysaccharide pyruvyl transferase WcaK-like protein